MRRNKDEGGGGVGEEVGGGGGEGVGVGVGGWGGGRRQNFRFLARKGKIKRKGNILTDAHTCLLSSK
jgi:hypothetical protein